MVIVFVACVNRGLEIVWRTRPLICWESHTPELTANVGSLLLHHCSSCLCLHDTTVTRVPRKETRDWPRVKALRKPIALCTLQELVPDMGRLHHLTLDMAWLICHLEQQVSSAHLGFNILLRHFRWSTTGWYSQCGSRTVMPFEALLFLQRVPRCHQCSPRRRHIVMTRS